ncbi:MAG: hypothetical protein ABIQ88_09550 [Chitinophagaceae bacterium]
MNISRDNYEEFFMQYADNELCAAERASVEAFMAANPDLAAELDLFQQFKLTPDEAVVFTGKDVLMKNADDRQSITLFNYYSFFILYADDELTNNEKAGIENFVYQHPKLQAEFELMQQLRLSPDRTIVFENKANLYRKEEDERVVPFRWWRLAAAAIVLLVAGIFWIYQSKNNDIPEQLVKRASPVTNPQLPPLHNKSGELNTDTSTITIKQADIETVAASVNSKEVEQVKKEEPAPLVAAPVKTEANPQSNSLPSLPSPAGNENVAVIITDKLTGSTIASIAEPRKKVEINTNIAAAASKSVKNLQLTYLDTDENNQKTAAWASAANNEKVEVLNTSVNTKNSMRGFLRKASRLIAKKANLDDGEGNRKGILIGGFEIAVR